MARETSKEVSGKFGLGLKNNNAEKNLTGATPCLFFCLFEMVMKGWL